MAHRLAVDQPVSPNTQDAGTVFRINSTFMDIIEPSLLENQWFITATVGALLFTGAGYYFYSFTHADPAPPFWMAISNIFSFGVILLFLGIAFKFGAGLFFGLRHRPIRFHRGERKLYAIRKRRFFAKPGEGDVVWEVPWSNDSIFCLHRRCQLSANCSIFAITRLMTMARSRGSSRSAVNGCQPLRWSWRSPNGTIGASS